MTSHEVSDEGLLRRIHRELLQPHFPFDEMVDVDDFVHGARTGQYRLHVEWHEDEPVAVAVGEYWAESRVLLLSWLAVGHGLRGDGIGRRTLATALDEWQEALHPRFVLGEVEHPATIPDLTAYGDPTARLRFYNSFGVRVLPVEHVQPSLRPGGSPVHNLMLTVFREDGEVPGSEVEAEPIRAFLRAYLPDDEQVRSRVLDGLDGDRLTTISMTAPFGELPNAPR